MENSVKYNHSIDDIVYYRKMESIPTVQQCRTCEGEGVVFAKSGKKIKCPTCDGSKTFSNSGSINEVCRKGIIKNIIIDISKDVYTKNIENKIVYYLENVNEPFSQYQLFKTSEEVEKTFSNGIMGYTK